MKKQLKILLWSNYLNIFAYSLFGPLYAMFVLHVGGSTFHAGATWALYMFVAGIVMFFFSKIADRSQINRIRMIISGYFLLSFGALAFTFVQNPFDLYLVQLLNAVGVGMLDPAWKAVYATSEDKGKEVLEWAFFDGGDKILIAIAAFLGGIFVTYFSFTSLFFVIFVIQLIAAFYSLKLLKK